MSFDLVISTTLQSLLATLSYGDAVAVFLAHDLLLWFFLIVMLLAFKDRESLKQTIASVTIAPSFAFFAAWVGGRAIERMRPFRAFPEQIRLLTHAPLTFFSMPSGHATVAFALASSMSWLMPRYRFGFYVIASLVALGRVLVGVHFTSDVLAGALLGIAVSTVVERTVLKRL